MGARARVVWVRGALGPCRRVVWRGSVLGARGGRGLPVKKPGLIALQGSEVSNAVDLLDLGWTAVAVRAWVGLVFLSGTVGWSQGPGWAPLHELYPCQKSSYKLLPCQKPGGGEAEKQHFKL